MTTETSKGSEISLERLQELAMESAGDLIPEATKDEAKALVSGFINTLGLVGLANEDSILVSTDGENIFSFPELPREKFVNELVACCGWNYLICESFLERLEAEIKELEKGSRTVEIELLGGFARNQKDWQLHM